MAGSDGGTYLNRLEIVEGNEIPGSGTLAEIVLKSLNIGLETATQLEKWNEREGLLGAP
jgi:hypothetical protein